MSLALETASRGGDPVITNVVVVFSNTDGNAMNDLIMIWNICL